MVIEANGLMHLDNEDEEALGDHFDKVEKFVQAMACIALVGFVHDVPEVFILILHDYSFKSISSV